MQMEKALKRVNYARKQDLCNKVFDRLYDVIDEYTNVFEKLKI